MNIPQPQVSAEPTDTSPENLQTPKKQSVDQTDLLVSLTTENMPYVCPGESLPINRSVHLARLRSHYGKCKQCPHRHEAEHFSADAHQHLEQWWAIEEKAPDELRDGLGSESPNEFPAHSGRIFSQTFAAMQWERKAGQQSQKQSQQTTSSSNTRPTIVMGHDFSEASLEMMRESVRGVREQGGRIIDVGGITAACMTFVLEHLHADAGIHAISRRADGIGAGLDLYGPNAIPLSGESLYEVQAHRDQAQHQRFSRSDGGLTPFPARKAYLGSLWKHFQGIRPFRIWANTTNQLVIDLLQELFEDLPGTLIISQKQFHWTPNQPTDPQQLRDMGNDLLEHECELGILLDSQGQSCLFLDAEGKQIPASELLSLLYQQINTVPPNETANAPLVMLGEELQTEEMIWPPEKQDVVRHRQSLREYFTRGMTTAKTSLGYDALNRYWFADPTPICDGIVTLGKVLQAKTASD